MKQDDGLRVQEFSRYYLALTLTGNREIFSRDSLGGSDSIDTIMLLCPFLSRNTLEAGLYIQRHRQLHPLVMSHSFLCICVIIQHSNEHCFCINP